MAEKKTTRSAGTAKKPTAAKKPAAAKAALLLSTATGQTEPVEAYFNQLVGFLGMENCGVCKAVGDENMKAEKMAEIKAWAAGIH